MGADGAGSAHQTIPIESAAPCPGPGELSAFSRGALPLASLKSIAEHVSVCPQCDSKVSTLISHLEKRITRTQARPGSGPSGPPVLDSGNVALDGAHVERSVHDERMSSAEAPTAPLRLGQYRLVRQLGRGGMGVVYQAWHERLLRDVAIKFVPVDSVKDLLDVERLRREMAAVGTMRHPNVVYATDAGETEGVHYLVMEYVDGIDLSKLVTRTGPLGTADACEIIRQAAVGLDHIRRQGMIHRDLKPSNLMLAADGTVKILDLGLARLHWEQYPEEEMTRNGYLLGTIDYVSPEQARDAHGADIRSDIYSLGCTFYKLLAGEPPFGGSRHSSAASKILAHAQALPPPLADFRGDVPLEAEEILRKMLAKEPGDRFQTPAELRRALEPLAAGADLRSLLSRATVTPVEGASTHEPVTASTLLDRTPRSGPAIALPKVRLSRWQVVTALAVVLIVGGGIALWSLGIGGRTWSDTPTYADISKKSEIRYPGALGLSSVSFPIPEVVQLEATDIQLVKLGLLRAGRQKFAVTIDQSKTWIGQFGIFMGYREVPHIRTPQETFGEPLAVFQLLYFEHEEPNVDGAGKMVRSELMRVKRERVFIRPMFGPGPGKYPLESGAEAMIRIPARGEVLRVEIEFDDSRMTKVTINGREIKELANDEVNSKFSPNDYVGAFGFYNAGEYSTRFSQIDFSALRKD